MYIEGALKAKKLNIKEAIGYFINFEVFSKIKRLKAATSTLFK